VTWAPPKSAARGREIDVGGGDVGAAEVGGDEAKDIDVGGGDVGAAEVGGDGEGDPSKPGRRRKKLAPN
jgi:hypothetical protein